MNYVADFETTTDPNDCRVWGWMSWTLDEKESHRGLSIEDFFTWLHTLKKGDSVYFHNLKFDGEFVVYYLLTHGYELIKDRKESRPNTFQTLISDMGQWYSIRIVLSNGISVTLKDSLKVWSFTVEELAKSMGMDISKGSIDYEMHRLKGYEPTPEEWDYIDRDVRIVCRAMRTMISDGFNKLTAGANALDYYRKLMDSKWEYLFPSIPLSEDEAIRKSYRGGWTYVNPFYQGKEVGSGLVLDVNSLYPAMMRTQLLPYGAPLYFEGRYKENNLFPLYVQRILVDFHLKPGRFPTVQQKNSLRFAVTEYIRATRGDPIELTLTRPDMELFLEQYEIDSIEYLDGYMFHGQTGLFDQYVGYWMDKKEKAGSLGDKPRRNQSKLFMNSLYGKFAKRPLGRSKYPYLGEDGCVHLELGEEEERGGLYIPMGTFITAYARCYTIRSAQKLSERFLYADTDSLHLLGEDIPEEIETHSSHLGKWKVEGRFRKARYLRAKCYAEWMQATPEEIDAFLSENPDAVSHADRENGCLLSITCAGMPGKSKLGVSYDDFKIGLIIRDKLVPRHVPGGVILERTTFELKNH